MTTNKMNPAELKYNVEQTGSHFFERSSMKFFGDTMRNYGVRSKPVTIRTCYDESGNFTCHEGVDIECWELYRKNPVKHGLKDSAFFSVKTFERVYPVK